MARKVVGPTGSRRRRWFLLFCLVVAAASAVVFIPAAGADSVKGETFELDGNVAQTHPAAPTTYDWANFFDSSGSKLSLPSGYTASSFAKDFNTSTDRKGNTVFNTADASTYTIGSKDILDVNGWSCTPANNVTDKGDIMNAYAAAYTDPTSHHKFIFFGLERNANAGDANVAFWFLQGSASCPAAGGSFSGNHHNGDLLIVSAFTNGGSVSTINAYEWQNGALNTTPVANGGDCSSTTLTADPTCATSNTSALSGIPWLTENKTDGVGHSLQTGEFFEGGLDLSAPSVNLANSCFNTFVPDTRSSQSLTATLYDYALGQLGECTSTTTTTPVSGTNDNPPASSIPLAPADASVAARDKTVIAVSGIGSFNSSNATNLTWHICGPTASTSTQLCDGTAGNVGVALTGQAITTAGTYYSPTVTLTEAGRYCFRAEFAGDSNAGVPGSSDSRSSECFTIAPVSPTLSTQAGTGPVDFGGAVTDTATLSGTAKEQGTGGPTGSDGSINPTSLGGAAQGTITFTLYKADCTTKATGTGTNPQTVSVSGDNTYGPVSFTPDAPGTYHWVASYGGDSPNTGGTDHNTACDDTAEDVVVRQIPTTISTTQKVYPQDSATIGSSVSGNLLPSGGTVTFSLYGDGANTAANLANCQAGTATGRIYTRSFSTNSTPATSETFATDNTTVSVSASETMYWLVTYATGDTAHTGRQSKCTESTQTVFANDSGDGIVFP
jgi:hypothetical protein